jgi:threonine/homoserine/homoserine lactone efflux protein
MFLTGHSGTATLPGMSVEFLLTSLVVVLIPGTGVVYTSAIGGGRRRGLFAAVRWAGVPYLVNAGPDGYLP